MALASSAFAAAFSSLRRASGMMATPNSHQYSSLAVLVQINPIRRDKLPTTSGEIMDRLNEITFNAALMAEMRAIDFVKRLLSEGKLDPARYKDVLMHRIDGGEALEESLRVALALAEAGAVGEAADEATFFQRRDQAVDAGFRLEIQGVLHLIEGRRDRKSVV